jgi:YD repeat-containing protein
VNPPGGGEDDSSSTYDAAGRVTKSTDEFGRETFYTYDGNGRLIETKYPDNSVSQTVYDEAGHVKFEEWPMCALHSSRML